MDTIAVLMSTYNGVLYLAEQMESILAQEGVDLTLYIRDDGSSDKTVDMIKRYREHNHNIRFVIGENLGVGNSFMQLVRVAGDEYDFYAFADQDDIWMPEKLLKAVECIKKEAGPCCYCSNQTLVNDKGEVMRIRHEKRIDADYKSILCNNEVTGCTMVWNRKLQQILIDERALPSPELLRKRIHDVWVAMVAAVVGKIYYDPNSYIYYRQHENNVVGVKKQSLTNIIGLWKKKLADPNLRRGRSDLANEIISGLDQNLMDESVYNNLFCYANYRNSLKNMVKLFGDHDIFWYSKEDFVTYVGKILFGLF